MSLFIKKKHPKDDLLINEINKTKVALEAAYSNFQNVVDPDLIDSCIYEMNAVQNRYKFLLKQAKASDKVTAEKLPVKKLTVEKAPVEKLTTEKAPVENFF